MKTKIQAFPKPERTKKKKTKSKGPSKSKVIKELTTIAKKIAKIRDNYICQKCGKKVEGINAQGSHVIPVSHGNVLKWDVLNIKTMCYHCHLNWWHKNPIEAGKWFEQKFPDRYKYIMERKEIKVQFCLQDLLEQLTVLKNQYNNLLKEYEKT